MRNNFFDQSNNSMPRIVDQAPTFRSVTSKGTIYFPADYFGKRVILFCYPTASTPVQTPEFLAMARMHKDSKALNCQLIGLPVDRLHSRIDELSSIKEKIEYKSIKIYQYLESSEKNSVN